MDKISKNEINCIYLLYGEDTYLLESTLKKLKKSFGVLIQGINYVQIDETNIDTLISEIETPAFGYEKKLIIIKANLLKKKKRRSNR